VRDLSETPTLISIEVNVVNIEGSSLKRGNAEEGIRLGVDVDSAVSEGIGSDIALVLLSELKNNFDLVVLQGNQGERKTRVSAEPELEGDIKSSRLSLLEGSTSKSEGIANHIIITYLVSGLLGKLVPDIKPITVMFVDALTTNLDLDVADQNVTDVVDPTKAERFISSSSCGALNKGKSNLKVNTVNQITITRNGASNTLAEIGSSVKGLLNRFDREVSVTAVNDLKESDLGISS